MKMPKTARNRATNNVSNSRVQSRNRVWRRNDPLALSQVRFKKCIFIRKFTFYFDFTHHCYRQPIAPTVIITQPPLAPLSSSLGGRSKVRGNSVVISNLKAGITHKDVEDLFGDIGPASVQMIDSHTAIVTYGDPNHAGRAVEVYHNRLLDGYPMQCTLIPSANTTTQASSGFVSRTMRQIFS